ncbi:class A beta-lactamase BlaA [Streptomyces capparidis]
MSAAGLLTSARPATASAPAPAADASRAVERELLDLEQRYRARLGVYAVNTRTGRTVAHRADERFAFCSTFKGIAVAAVLRDHARCAPLDRVVHYPPADVLRNSPITAKHVDSGMTVGELAAAAIQYSDAAAANLLLRQIGGPAGLTEFCRSIGDTTTRSDRWEPELTTAVPGDPRDTTTPRALGRTYQRLTLGRALSPRDRARLVTWLKGNTTSVKRFRAGLPDTWVLGDKTGTGDYATANDVGVAWTTKGTPLLLTVMSSKDTKDAPIDNALVADAARVLAGALAPGE